METTDPQTTAAAYLLNDRRADEDPWHELATGGLTREQVARIRRHMESEEQIERKLELFGPSSDDARKERLDALLERFFDVEPGSSGSGGAPPAEAPPGGNVVPLGETSRRRERGRWSFSVVNIVVLAAAVLLVCVVQRPGSTPDMAMLPGFELQLEEGWSGDMRGAGDTAASPACDQRYHREQSLAVRLVPDQALDEGLSVAALAQPEAGDARWLVGLPVMQKGSGVLTVEQRVAELGLPPGVWTLTFYVMRKREPLPSSTLRALEPGEHPGVFVVRGTICIVE